MQKGRTHQMEKPDAVSSMGVGRRRHTTRLNTISIETIGGTAVVVHM